jgi:hypothetical protein
MEDFVPIDRGIINHWIYKDAEYFKVWFEMLYRARYSREAKTDMEKGIVYTINYGEFMFGRPSWSDRLGISEQRLKTLIKKLIDHKMITLTKTYRYFSIYYVNNFEKYRKSNQQNNQQKHLEPQGFEDDSNQQTNLLSTSCQPAANLLSTTKEEGSNTVKKVRKKKDTYPELFEQFWNTYPRQIDRSQAVAKWNAQINKKSDPQQMITAAYNYMVYVSAEGTEERYMKHPKTFLNGETWKEFIEPKIILTTPSTRKPYQSKADRAEEQRNALKQSILGGVSIEDINQGRGRVDITPDPSSVSQLRLEL